LQKIAIVFVVRINFLPLAHHIVLTILQFIGHLFLGWLAFTSPAQAPTTPSFNYSLEQRAQLEQSIALPLWRESATSFWSHFSESLEESSAENEESQEGEPAMAQHQALSAWHGRRASFAKHLQSAISEKLPLYLWHCCLKIHLD